MPTSTLVVADLVPRSHPLTAPPRSTRVEYAVQTCSPSTVVISLVVVIVVAADLPDVGDRDLRSHHVSGVQRPA